jgi:hypothetical protein
LVVLGAIPLGGCLSGPLLVYGATPADVDPSVIRTADYAELDRTKFSVDRSSVPGVPVDTRIGLRGHLVVYVGGVDVDADAVSRLRAANAALERARRAAGDPEAATTPTSNDTAPEAPFDVDDVDPANASVVGVTSVSALQVGPVPFNPLVTASDPRLLGSSGYLIDYVEALVGANVTDLSVTNGAPVEMLGHDAQVMTLRGRVFDPDGRSVEVSVFVSRVVDDGDLVTVFGVAPRSTDGAAERFRTLVEHVRHDETVPRGRPATDRR